MILTSKVCTPIAFNPRTMRVVAEWCVEPWLFVLGYLLSLGAVVVTIMFFILVVTALSRKT
jgi:hypothetical protein